MPARTTTTIGAPCWVDIASSDREATVRFYTGLFGWEAEEPNPEFGGYFNFRLHGEWVAGCMGNMSDGEMPDSWSVYLTAGDAAAVVAAAEARGCPIIVPAMPVGDLGVMGFVVEPGGAAVGLWQPGEHRGFGRYREAGAPAWFDVYSADPAASVRFYEEVFGWTTQRTGEGSETFTVMVDGDDWQAAVLPRPDDATPTVWNITFGCDDTDATVAKAVSLGGTVKLPPEDSPYGRVAAITDATGAVLYLVSTNDQMPG